MQVIESAFIDTNYVDDISRYKANLLVTDIIKIFHPLFYEEHRKKRRVLKQKTEKMRSLQQIISKLKTNLIDTLNNIDIETLKNKILKVLVDLAQRDNDKVDLSEYVEVLNSSDLPQLESTFEKLQKLSLLTTNPYKV
jgi:hypothetical protein